MLQKIDHIGIAVDSLAEARFYYEEVLGLARGRVEEIAAWQVRVAFYDLGGVHIELLEPMTEDSPVAKFLKKNGPGVHHLAFRSDDVAGQLARAAAKGCRLITSEPVSGAGGKKIAFLHPGSTFGVLTEFCSSSDHGGKGAGPLPSLTEEQYEKKV